MGKLVVVTVPHNSEKRCNVSFYQSYDWCWTDAEICVEDLIAVSEINNFVILEISINDEEGFGWIEGEGNLSSLIGLRQEILQGDYRLLYLAWLKAITYLELDEEELEPPVPPGLDKLQHFRMLWGTVAAISKPVFEMFRIN